MKFKKTILAALMTMVLSQSVMAQTATIGAVAKYDMFNATALHHTDGVDQIGVGLQTQTDDLTISVRADRLQTKEGGSTVYTAGLVYKF